MRPNRTLRRGSSLIAVFWLVSILSLGVFTAIQLVNYELRRIQAQTQGKEARHYAEMGIAVAANPVVQRTDVHLLNMNIGTGGFQATITSEGSRFNINALLAPRSDGAPADKTFLRELFAYWEVEEDIIDELADALVDWVDPNDEEELNGAESRTYEEERGVLNQPFNRPFLSLEEMRLVRHMDYLEDANPNWRSWFTIWSSGGLDVNEASPEFLARAVDITESEAEAMIAQVRGPDGIRGNDDDQPFQSAGQFLDQLGISEIERLIVEPRLTANDPTTRIESIGYAGTSEGQTKHKITLILRNRTGNPSILERREELVE